MSKDEVQERLLYVGVTFPLLICSRKMEFKRIVQERMPNTTVIGMICFARPAINPNGLVEEPILAIRSPLLLKAYLMNIVQKSARAIMPYPQMVALAGPVEPSADTGCAKNILTTMPINVKTIMMVISYLASVYSDMP